MATNHYDREYLKTLLAKALRDKQQKFCEDHAAHSLAPSFRERRLKRMFAVADNAVDSTVAVDDEDFGLLIPYLKEENKA